MEIFQLKYFIQVCNDMSLTKAAQKLHISQQGLSKTIKNLEDEFNVSLFDRSSKGLKLTEFGSIFLEKCEKVVREFDAMIVFMHESAKQEKITITIGMPDQLNTNFLANVICKFGDKYPYVNIKIFEGIANECEKKLEENLLDISFAVKTQSIDKFDYIPILSTPVKLLVSKNNPLSSKKIVKLKDLRHESFIMLSPDYKFCHIINEWCMKTGFKPITVFSTSQKDLLVELVGLNKGITFIPESHTLRALKFSDNVSVVPFEDNTINYEVGFVTNRNKKSNNIIQDFINCSLGFLQENKLVQY